MAKPFTEAVVPATPPPLPLMLMFSITVIRFHILFPRRDKKREMTADQDTSQTNLMTLITINRPVAHKGMAKKRQTFPFIRKG
jgi:hypothetical protein